MRFDEFDLVTDEWRTLTIWDLDKCECVTLKSLKTTVKNTLKRSILKMNYVLYEKRRRIARKNAYSH